MAGVKLEIVFTLGHFFVWSLFVIPKITLFLVLLTAQKERGRCKNEF